MHSTSLAECIAAANMKVDRRISLWARNTVLASSSYDQGIASHTKSILRSNGIKTTNQSFIMNKPRDQHQNMKDLMTGSHKVKPSRKPTLRNLFSVSKNDSSDQKKNFPRKTTHPRRINHSPCNIQETHQCHPLDAQTPLLHRKSVEEDTMRDEKDRREAEARVHQRSIFAESGS